MTNRFCLLRVRDEISFSDSNWTMSRSVSDVEVQAMVDKSCGDVSGC